MDFWRRFQHVAEADRLHETQDMTHIIHIRGYFYHIYYTLSWSPNALCCSLLVTTTLVREVMQSPLSICPSVCFHSIIETDWPLTLNFCKWVGHDHNSQGIKSQLRSREVWTCLFTNKAERPTERQIIYSWVKTHSTQQSHGDTVLETVLIASVLEKYHQQSTQWHSCWRPAKQFW